VIKSIKYDVPNCYSYDAGVFEWALSYPDHAVLLGETPIEKDSIISKEKFTAHLLSPDEFDAKSLNDNTQIYDVRDREQRRGGSGIFMFRDKPIDLDNTRKLDWIISNAISEHKVLFFYDQKGKQVRWLQYFIEKKGLKNYYFIKGGAAAYFKNLQEKQAKSI
jgi:predicted sulfurtransferase